MYQEYNLSTGLARCHYHFLRFQVINVIDYAASRALREIPGNSRFRPGFFFRSALPVTHFQCCVAAAIGWFGAKRPLCWIKPVHPANKGEGICAKRVAEPLQVILVSDADNPKRSAKPLESSIDYFI